MFVNLAPGIHRSNVDNHRIAVYREQDSPPAHAGLSHSRTVGELGGQARIEWIVCKLRKPSLDSAFRGTITPVENLFGFARETLTRYFTVRVRGYIRPAI
jgi:hypothetical protein